MPSISKLVDELSRDNRNGLAFANRYSISMPLPQAIYSRFPDTESLDLLCDATGLPGRQIATLDYQAHKQSIKVPYGFLNEDVTFTFMLTGDYYAKKVFEAWAESIIDFTNYKAKYLMDYTSTVTIFQTSQDKMRSASTVPPAATRTEGGGETVGSMQDNVVQLSAFNVNATEIAVTDKKIYGVKLINAYPVTIAGIELGNAAENTPQKLSVVMTYENFEVLPRYRD